MIYRVGKRTFSSLEGALIYADRVFRRRGVVIGIEEVKK